MERAIITLIIGSRNHYEGEAEGQGRIILEGVFGDLDEDLTFIEVKQKKKDLKL